MARWWAVLAGGAAALLVVGCSSAAPGPTDATDVAATVEATEPAVSPGWTDGAGGGFAQESAATITAEAEKDMTALRSVRIAGVLVLDGERTVLDLFLTDSGECEGSMSLGSAGSIRIKGVNGRSWMKPDADFWQTYAGEAAPTLREIVGRRWVVLPRDDRSLGTLCDLDEMLSEADATEDDPGAEVTGTERVRGQEAVRVRTETDAGEDLVAWVSVADPHHVLEMEVAKGKESGTIRFTDFDADRTIEPPAKADVVDLEQLQS